MRIYTAAQMKLLEQRSDEIGISYLRLMENAGTGAAAFIRKTFDLSGKRCIVFCGKGNNGGDGFVVARKLFENGAHVIVVLTDGPPVTECAAHMYDTLQRMELAILDDQASQPEVDLRLAESDIIVDAVFGTGFKGTPDPRHTALFERINGAISAVISLDLPSGTVCDSGWTSGCVRADFTVAFDACKPVHYLLPAREFCGTVTAIDIGIPPEAVEDVPQTVFLIGRETVVGSLPSRSADSHKGTYGRLLSIAGNMRYTGAAILSTQAAMRSGTGIVSLACPKSTAMAVASAVVGAVLAPLPESEDGSVSPDAVPAVLQDLTAATACLLGCGLGLSRATDLLTEAVLSAAQCPVILDADGINSAARNIHLLDGRTAPLILTPHIGEMSRLCGLPAETVKQERLHAASGFAQQHGVILVLKDSSTVVALPNGHIYINTTGNAGLARGGSGDVLAGLIAGLCAQGTGPASAAICGVFLHGMAADLAAGRLTQRGMLPSDLPAALCEAFAGLGI